MRGQVRELVNQYGATVIDPAWMKADTAVRRAVDALNQRGSYEGQGIQRKLDDLQMDMAYSSSLITESVLNDELADTDESGKRAKWNSDMTIGRLQDLRVALEGAGYPPPREAIEAVAAVERALDRKHVRRALYGQ